MSAPAAALRLPFGRTESPRARDIAASGAGRRVNLCRTAVKAEKWRTGGLFFLTFVGSCRNAFHLRRGRLPQARGAAAERRALSSGRTKSSAGESGGMRPIVCSAFGGAVGAAVEKSVVWCVCGGLEVSVKVLLLIKIKSRCYLCMRGCMVSPAFCVVS